MIECECKELLSEPDNIEYIRDQIGAILSVELANQFALAQEAADPNARDYNIAVYIENDDPLQYVDGGANPFPLVNLTLVGSEKTSGSTNFNKHRMSATFLLDAYATGNTESGEDAGMRASLKACPLSCFQVDLHLYRYNKLTCV